MSPPLGKYLHAGLKFCCNLIVNSLIVWYCNFLGSEDILRRSLQLKGSNGEACVRYLLFRNLGKQMSKGK